ncbi:hypothetical protein C8A05DRAFT_34943 [Staphylotrichum tortipilum]|uniref:Reverse transcriptase domain-containing protein n=1 Tax=Staphylotrichum tortipilum TaxID=2831512 RepID=A0AAN6MJS8_9PEZI|nr:hypothetical protein C8A05DRAFT_34943 [Staphylotrichum longicolle]
MATPKSVLSKTLQSITLSKIRELESRHKSYEARKRDYVAKADAAADERDRLACLLEAVRELYPTASKDAGLNNLQRWLDQSRYDASIPTSKLVSFNTQLRAKLETQSRKLDMAHLYSRLLTEWMEQPLDEDLPASEDDPDNDSFELVERQRQRLSELVDKFESVVFTPLETDEAEITSFLDKLFPDEDSQKELEKLRKKIADVSAKFMAETAPFNEESLTSCIKGLLTEDILSDEKQAILRDFLESDVAKSEIADVLNMRFSDIKEWHWDAGVDGIRVMPRRGLNGKYRVWADDDILQMIFVQYIGIRLCNLLKPALKSFMEVVCSRDLEGHMAPTSDALERRRYYLNNRIRVPTTIEEQRKSDYFSKFFLSQLPATETSLFDGDNKYDDDDDDDDDDDSDYEINRNVDVTTSPQKRSGIKQQLLRHLTAELIVHRLRNVTYDTHEGPGNGVALVQTDLQWYATGLSHSTVFAVMRYIGFGQDWIDFFKKYLESPLNLDAASDDRPQLGPRIRKRGVPMAHASEKFTGELVLFFMDLAVNRETGILLYRLHDDIWLVGEPDRSAQAWSCMQSFAKVFGLDFNKAKTGSIYIPGSSKKNASIAASLPTGPVKIGFLALDPESGKWVIDQKLVVAHVDQLKKQLSESNSLLSWVQTWNSCIGRFFSHTFGEPAYCFGRDHVNQVLDTYQQMLKRLFPGSNGSEGSVVEHVKEMIQQRFGVSDLPDSFIYLPEQLGGLGLRNPFVGLFLVRNKITDTPEEIATEFLKGERERYMEARKAFEATEEKALRRRRRYIYSDEESAENGAISELDLRVFFSLEEYSRYRERQSRNFFNTFERLVSVPETEEIALSKEVESGLREFLADSVRLDSEKKWFLQLYAKELLENFGGLSLVDKQFLPVGVLAMMRGKKVSWNMIL